MMSGSEKETCERSTRKFPAWSYFASLNRNAVRQNTTRYEVNSPARASCI